MLLLHQIGSVKIGEIVRYSITYTPAYDRILPAPEYLYLKVRNTSSSALRAAFIHGPYNLYVDAYPAHFDPNKKFAHPRKYGVPEFEPMLKAGGTWTCRLLVPEHIRHEAGTGNSSSSGGNGDGGPPSVSWIINVSSQVIFSTSAAVHYEVLLARDPKALESGGGITAGMPVLLGGDSGSGKGNGSGQGQVLQPGKVSDYQRGRDGRHPDQPRGVFSRAICMRLEDTMTLWNKPELPGWNKPPSSMRIHSDESGVTVEAVSGGAVTKNQQREQKQQQDNKEEQQHERQKTLEQSNESKSQAKQQARETIPAPKPGQKKKKVHLVILTHGLHSNLGGDMLYIKESIDVAVQQAKIDRKARKEKERVVRAEARRKSGATDEEEEEDEEDEEDVIVRGYPGNATRTERGIKYLGKRLARYILSMTYPDQPYLPSSKRVSEKTAVVLQGGNPNDVTSDHNNHASHKRSSIHNVATESLREYQFTKISFIAHSLGGLVQTYAVAYIQKHSPQFFDLIEPINFIGMASPFLGLNHENPMYVKFALDFGLVGRTGQDLGLTWRAPTIARSGWSSLVGNLSDKATSHKKVLGEPQPESKPLLRILPTGPAHTALRKFRNRTVYSNVVNDGIVPLRTSCLLFLDWQGLDRVEKARRETGLVETVVSVGWAELVGNNATTPRAEKWDPSSLTDEDDEDEVQGKADEKKTEAGGDNSSGTNTPNVEGHNKHEVPQPPTNATQEDDRQSLRAVAVPSSFDHDERPQLSSPPLPSPDPAKLSTASTNNSNPFSNFFSNLFKTNSGNEDPTHTPGGTTPRPDPVASGGSSSNPKSPPLGQNPHPKKSPSHASSMSSKKNKIYQRSQTLRSSDWDAATPSSATSTKSRVTTGQELDIESGNGGSSSGMSAPPKTSFFESATDIINPKIPSVEFLIDPSKRPRAIFHDRVYHPSDIPAPPLKRRATGNLALRRLSFQQRSKTSLSSASAGNSANNSAGTSKSRSSSPYQERITPSASAPVGSSGSSGVPHMDSGLSAQDYDDMANTNPDRDLDEVIDTSSIKVEEKIARAYHRGLSWRKVLVKLEPDAHNNMVVRRLFANAFGWPVVKHMVDAHFSDSAAARMRDEDEDNTERARPLHEAPDEHGMETEAQKHGHEDTQMDGANGKDDDIENDETGEAKDQAMDLPDGPVGGHSGLLSSRAKAKSSASLSVDNSQHDNVAWSDRDFNDDSGDDSDSPDGSTGAADDDHLAYGGPRQAPKSPLASSTTGVSVTATGGTTTGPQSPLASPLANPPTADDVLGEVTLAEPKASGNKNELD